MQCCSAHRKQSASGAGTNTASDSVTAPVTSLDYVKAGTTKTSFLGMPSIFQNPITTYNQIGALVNLGASMEKRTVPLQDARAVKLKYEHCGFKLEPLKSKVEDWSQVAIKGSAEQATYQAELEAIIRRLHPAVKAFAWSAYLLRGGPGENGPAAGAIHLDWFPDVERVKEYIGQHPEGYHDLKHTAAQVTSQKGNEGLTCRLVLGLWKPRNHSNPVKESPLIVCDPATVDIAAEAVPQEQNFYVHADGNLTPVSNLAASLKYTERQQWYYFKDQTAEEVLIFRHATLDDPSFANFHCAGVLPLPDGAEKRSSVETRVMLYF